MTARTFDQVRKDITVGDVHLPTSIGGEDDDPDPDYVQPDTQPRLLKWLKSRLFKVSAQAAADNPAAQPGGGESLSRAMKPMDDACSHVPFPYDEAALGGLRPDQVPRFLGALTDQDQLPMKTVGLDTLTAIQNRVDTGKVTSMAADRGTQGKPPVVVRHGNKNYIADGHHRLAAAWLRGDQSAEVRFKDLGPVSNVMKSWRVEIEKTVPDQCLVFGWASVIEKNGVPEIDYQGDIISPAEMEEAFYKFVETSRAAGEMHDRTDAGHLVECMVFTKEKQAALGIDLGKVGTWVGFRMDPVVFQKIKSGEYPAFSIGGLALREPVSP